MARLAGAGRREVRCVSEILQVRTFSRPEKECPTQCLEDRVGRVVGCLEEELATP